MDNELRTAVANFVSRVKGTKTKGVKVSKKEFRTLNEKFGGILPDWYVELFTTYPISKAIIYNSVYEPEGEDDGYRPVEIASPKEIHMETALCYPGLAIKHLGYFCFTNDLTGSGDPGFTTNAKGDNPPVFLVYHDVSDIGEEIEKAGMRKIAESLSDFFNKAKPLDN